MRDSETFLGHAERCQLEADEATLDNVRDRALRAVAAWTAMAKRSERSERLKDAHSAPAGENGVPVTEEIRG